MKIFKKIIGFILVLSFISLVIFAFIYNIMNAGWYFVFSMFFILAVVLLFLLGLRLLTDND